MRVKKKIGMALVGIFLFASIRSLCGIFNLKEKKSKMKKEKNKIKIYFDNCPIGIQSSEIEKTPMTKIEEGIKIMEKMNDIE